MTKYTFKKPAVQLDKMLICPQCNETLSQIDISSFGACPYCDHKLDNTPELEDYLLKPAVDHWMRMQEPANTFDMANMILPEDEVFE